MEEPASFDADALLTEKLKVLRAVRLPKDLGRHTVRGQYAAAWQGGAKVRGYLEEDGIDPTSKTDTYAAIKLGIDNRRWAGVPFYLRTGKRLGRLTEIAVVFQRAPHSPFDTTATEELGSNAIVIRVQPDEGITVRFGSKVPGTSMEIRDVSMDFAYGESFTESSPEAYERLILDVLLATPTSSPAPGGRTVLEDPRPDRAVLGAHGTPARYASATGAPPKRTTCSHETDGAAPAMKTDLTDTTASKINKALVLGRRAIGTPAVGMVLTMVIVTDEENAYDAIKAAEDAAHEHPSRTLVDIKRHALTPREPHPPPAGRGGPPRLTRAPARPSCCGPTATSPTTPTRWSLPLLLPDAPVVGPAAD
ncbi:Glucose-6-phosphate 1-dehydrogenase [Streptomyces microflavus]